MFQTCYTLEEEEEEKKRNKHTKQNKTTQKHLLGVSAASLWKELQVAKCVGRSARENNNSPKRCFM